MGALVVPRVSSNGALVVPRVSHNGGNMGTQSKVIMGAL